MKLSTMRRRYLREATVMLLITGLAVRIRPAQVFAWANRPLRHTSRFTVDEKGWVGWSVETMGARRWINASCLTRALAAQAMLRRRGIASRLCLGVSCSDATLSAHAWVEIGQEVIVGGPEIGRFTRLTEFGGGVVQL